MAIIAIDLGGTKLAGAIFDAHGKIFHKTIVPLDGRTGKEVGALICETIGSLLQAGSKKKLTIEGIGICVPGIARQKTGRVWAPNIPGWENYPLKKEVFAALKKHQRPVGTTSTSSQTYPKKKWDAVERIPTITVDSDRACYILGEMWRGAARGCQNAIFLAVGTGIGAGILIDGNILRGANDIAGAIGWMALDRPFENKYKSCGCFEYHASGEGLAKVAKEFSAPFANAHELFEAYARGSSIAQKTLQQAIEFWGMAVANLVSLFNPEKIIFGGGVFGPATKFLPQIFAEAKKWAQPISIREVKLQASKLGGDAGLYGAACLALRNGEK